MEASSLADGTGAAALRASLALLAVVAAIFATAWLARRLRGRLGAGGGWFRVRAAHALSPRERVLLVEAAGAHLLLSVGSQGVRVLHRYASPPELPEAAPAPSFGEALARKRGAAG
jgi:flagellar protein FliO/FliZ